MESACMVQCGLRPADSRGRLSPHESCEYVREKPTRPRDSLPDRGGDRGRAELREKHWLAAPWEMGELVRGWRLWRLPRPPREAARRAEWPIRLACGCRGSTPEGDDLRHV